MKIIFPVIFSLIFTLSFSLKGQYQIPDCRHFKNSNLQIKPGHLQKSEIANSRSDTFDILNYNVSLDLTNWQGKVLKGECDISFKPKFDNIDYLNLDLLEMTLDSVVGVSGPLNFVYNDTLLHIDLSTPVDSGDFSMVTVYYHGVPQTDPSGFGGFHWTSAYAFVLGVGFIADPHNFGRAWHPCFDNFVERATYHFSIISSEGRNAHCNGHFIGESTISGDTIQQQYALNSPIPSYLACVSVSQYRTVQQSHQGIQGTIPITLTAQAFDTTDMKNSFINLKPCIDAFEYWFGPHRWEKVGYVLTPVGAMEHPTCISYPISIADGTLGFEDIMAHELGHHWWGDLVTCETAEDMWINEGMAEYSSHLFTEFVYGRGAYLNQVLSNHLEVMQYAHIQEGGYRAISGVPHDLTYGTHVYNKGAAVAHNLRAYLGDDLFRAGIQSVMDSFQFNHINSEKLRDHLSDVTGLNLNSFFNDWVFNPGYSTFILDSMVNLPGLPPDNVRVHLKQKLRGAPNFHTNVPIQLTFFDSDWNTHSISSIVSGESSFIDASLPFIPEIVAVNRGKLLNIASSFGEFNVKQTGFYASSGGKVQLIVGEVSDSALIRATHHWVPPDPILSNPQGYQISSNRFWTIDGIIPENFKSTARLFYDGRQVIGGGNGYLDVDLVSVTEDSLVLLYRKDPSEDWSLYPFFTKNTLGSSTNAYGMVIIDSLQFGQYAFANGSFTLGIEDPAMVGPIPLTIYPNPADRYINALWGAKYQDTIFLELINSEGVRVFRSKIPPHTEKTDVNLPNLSSGNYFVLLKSKTGELLGSSQVVIFD